MQSRVHFAHSDYTSFPSRASDILIYPFARIRYRLTSNACEARKLIFVVGAAIAEAIKRAAEVFNILIEGEIPRDTELICARLFCVDLSLRAVFPIVNCTVPQGTYFALVCPTGYFTRN